MVARNFLCPMTEEPCINPVCTRERCADKLAEEARHVEAAAKAEDKAYWRKQLDELVNPPKDSN